MEFSQIVAQIHAYNRCWKNAKKQWGDTNPITTLLRNQKTDLQLHLLLHHQAHITYEIDHDQDSEEEILAITLKHQVSLNGINYYDAAHIPQRLTNNITNTHSPLKGQ